MATNPQPVAFPQRVTITPGNPPTVDPLAVEITPNQEVHWICNQDFVVYFRDETGGSPFHDKYFYPGKPRSGYPRGEITPDENKKYKYTVECGGYYLDPDVIVR